MDLKYFKDKQKHYEDCFSRLDKRLLVQWIASMLIVLMFVLSFVYVVSGEDIFFSKNIPIYLNPITLGMFAICLFVIIKIDDKSKKEVR